MPVELLFTSSPQGLHPGSSDYCTVRESAGLNVRLRQKLESQSSFEWLTTTSESAVAQNPPRLMHWIHRSGGDRIHFLSSIVAAIPDHTGRSNHVAHHIGFEADGLPTAGPITLLKSSALFRNTWNAKDRCEFTKQVPGLSAVAGLGPPEVECGSLAQRIVGYLLQNSGPLYIVHSRRIDIVPLLKQITAGSNDPWELTFATYFDPQQISIDCQLRCVIKESRYFAANGHQLMSSQPVIVLNSSTDGEGNDRWINSAVREPSVLPAPSSGRPDSYPAIRLPEKVPAAPTRVTSVPPRPAQSSRLGVERQRPSKRNMVPLLGIATACLAAIAVSVFGYHFSTKAPAKATQTSLPEISSQQVENRAAEYENLDRLVKELHSAVEEENIEAVRKMLKEDAEVDKLASKALASIRDYELETGYDVAPPGSPFESARRRTLDRKEAWLDFALRGRLMLANDALEQVLQNTVPVTAEALKLNRMAETEIEVLGQNSDNESGIGEHSRLCNLLTWFLPSEVESPATLLAGDVTMLNDNITDAEELKLDLIANDLIARFLSVDSSEPGQMVITSQSLAGSIRLRALQPGGGHRLEFDKTQDQKIDALLCQIGIFLTVGGQSRFLLLGPPHRIPTALLSGKLGPIDSEQELLLPTKAELGAISQKLRAHNAFLQIGENRIDLNVKQQDDGSLMCNPAKPEQFVDFIAAQMSKDNHQTKDAKLGTFPTRLLKQLDAHNPLISVALTNSGRSLKSGYERAYFRDSFNKRVYHHFQQCLDPGAIDEPGNLWAAVAEKSEISTKDFQQGLGMAATARMENKTFFNAYFLPQIAFDAIDVKKPTDDSLRELKRAASGAEKAFGDRAKALKAAQSDYDVLCDMNPEQHKEILNLYQALARAAWAQLSEAAPPKPPLGPVANEETVGLDVAILKSVQEQLLNRRQSADFQEQIGERLAEIQKSAEWFNQILGSSAPESHLVGIQLLGSTASWSRYTPDGKWIPIPAESRPTEANREVLLFESTKPN